MTHGLRVQALAAAASIAAGTAACSGAVHSRGLPSPTSPPASAVPNTTETPFGVVIDRSKPLLANRSGTGQTTFDVRLVSDKMLIVSFVCQGTGKGTVFVGNVSNTVECGGDALTSQFQVKRLIAEVRIQASGGWQVAVQQER